MPTGLVHIPPDLKELIEAATSAHPPPGAERHLVALCHRIAQAYLRQKQQAGHLSLMRLGLPLEDVSVDSLGELFKRDEKGQFIKLQTYFSRLQTGTDSPGALFSELRRLVFSEVNEQLFALYGQADHSLSKIIRNLKDNARSGTAWILERRGGMLWLMAEPSDGHLRPTMPPEYLEAYLMEQIRNPIKLDQVLVCIRAAFQAMPQYRAGYPIRPLAEIIRSAVVGLHVNLDDEPVTPRLTDEERDWFIQQSVTQTRAAMHPTYSHLGALYDHYFQAVRDWLVGQYVGPDSLSHREALQPYLGPLTSNIYREQHRKVFEYLVDCTRTHLVKAVRKELDASANRRYRKGP